MKCAGFLDQVEILNERAVAGHGLGSDAGTAGHKVLGADFGDKFLEGLGEKGFAEGAAAFVQSHRGVAAEEIPEARKGENFCGFERMDVGFAVAFAGERKDGVWPGLDAAVDESGEVDSKEGEGGVGDGVDEVADEMPCFGGEFEILATEGNDANVVFRAGERGDAVAEKPGAIDEVGSLEFPGGGFENPAAEVVVDGYNAGTGLENSAEALDLANEHVADGLVIDDTFLWNVQGGEASGVGFDLAESCGIQPLETFEAVLGSARFEFTEADDFGFVRGDNELSADFMGDSVFTAELGHEPNPAHGEAGFQGAGFVVEPAMEHAAVVRALVLARAVFFFKNANRRTRLAKQ